MNAAAVVDHFTWLASLGYSQRLIPIVPLGAPLSDTNTISKNLKRGVDSRGKIPGVRRSDGLWTGLSAWQKYVTEPEDLRRWAAMGAGVGIRTQGDLVGIDADCLDPDCAALIDAEVVRLWGAVPTRVGLAPKALYLVRMVEALKAPALRFGDNWVVEFNHGGQFVAGGLHPKTMRPYTWTRPLVAYDDLPVVTISELNEFISRLSEVLPSAARHEGVSAGMGTDGVERAPRDQEALRGRKADIRAALARIPNESAFGERGQWLKMGYALRGALVDDPDGGLELFQEFSSRWLGGENDDGYVEATWESIKRPDYQVGASWIFEQARIASGGAFRADAAQWYEPPVVEPEYVSLFPPEASLNGEVAAGIRATPFNFGTVPAPRQWVYGTHYVRRFLSATIAPSKVGKTALIVGESLAMASGKPILGVQVRQPRRVWLWNGEDPIEEMQRRVLAAMRLHGLTPEDVGDRLFLDSGRTMPITLAAMERNGARIAVPVRDGVIDELRKNRIDMLSIDPFVSSHRISENDNNAMDLVAKSWAQIADAAACSVDLTHHTRKLGGGAADATIMDSRGASALIAAVRSSRALAKMGKEEADSKGLADGGFRRLFRLSDVDMSMALPDPHTDQRWFELASVLLGNGSDEEPAGDDVGAVRLWENQNEIVEANLDEQAKALDLIASGGWRRDIQSRDAWVGVPVASAFHIDRTTDEGKKRIGKIMAQMFRDGLLEEYSALDEQRKRRQFVRPAPPKNTMDLFQDV